MVDSDSKMFQDVPIAPNVLEQSEQPSSETKARKAVWVEFAQIEAAEVEKKQLQQRLDVLAQQRDDVWAEISKLESSITAKVVLDARLSDISRGNSLERVAIHPELQRLQTAAAENAALQEHVLALRKEHEAASAEVVRQRAAERGEFHAQIERLTNTALELRAQGEQQRAEMAQLVSLVDAQSHSSESMTTQLSTLQEQNTLLTVRLEELTQQDTTAEAQLHTHIAQFESTLAELNVQHDKEHAAAHTTIAKLTTQGDTLLEQNNVATARLAQLMKLHAAENESSRAEIARLAGLLDAAQTEMTQYAERAAKADEWRAQAVELRNKLVAVEIEQMDNSAIASKEGFSMKEVFAVADKLLQQGITPTFASVRSELGKGSSTAIQLALNEWRMRKATQLPGI